MSLINRETVYRYWQPTYGAHYPLAARCRFFFSFTFEILLIVPFQCTMNLCIYYKKRATRKKENELAHINDDEHDDDFYCCCYFCVVKPIIKYAYFFFD